MWITHSSTRSELCRYIVGLLLAASLLHAAAEDTWVYAVEVSASPQDNGVLLTWRHDPYNPTTYTVSRKLKHENTWTQIAALGQADSYFDPGLGPGQACEYRIAKFNPQPLYRGYGYIYAGNQAPLIEDRGKVILIVASYLAQPLNAEIDRLQSDLTGDGWQVIRHDVDTAAAPTSVRDLIIADYNSDPSQVNTVFLLGRVPVRFSGNLNYDTHGSRPLPADAYYGDINGNWSTNPSFLPSDVELSVGRVDLASMPGDASPYTWPNEIELTRNYLDKDHAWRHKIIQVQRQALMGNRRGDEEGEATAAGGYRTFSTTVGYLNIIEANTDDTANPWDRWIAKISNNNDTFLWAYGCGGGQLTKISGLGTHGIYYDVWSSDIVDQQARAAFVMFFGSWFADWTASDNIMRSILATPEYGLASMISGRPHWFMHHTALGETIGYSARLSQNNSTLYQNHSNILTRAVYPALMGDPTLRLDQVAPPASLTAGVSGQTVTLDWSPPNDNISGYHIYRGSSPTGPFTRRTPALLTGTTYTETTVPQGNYTYLVKAIHLENGFSGSYYNSSQALFTSVTVQNTPQEFPPITLQATREANSIKLTWNTVPGAKYKIQGKALIADPNWSDLTTPLQATTTQITWTDATKATSSFYRIVRLQ